MLYEVIIASLVLGVFSSFHCIGMCGPLALALPYAHLGKGKQVLAIALYNLGRIFTYATLGLLFGLAGRRLYLAGMQQWFSIGMGVLMLLMAFQYFIRKKNIQPRFLNSFHYRVQSLMQVALGSKYIASGFLLGAANGLLPCGMVYLAIAGALSTGEVFNSVLFMAGFGLGTVPAMFSLAIIGLRVDMNVRRRIRSVMPVVIAGMAIILILRGLNLGIPFISPVMDQQAGPAVICH